MGDESGIHDVPEPVLAGGILSDTLWFVCLDIKVCSVSPWAASRSLGHKQAVAATRSRIGLMSELLLRNLAAYFARSVVYRVNIHVGQPGEQQLLQ